MIKSRIFSFGSNVQFMRTIIIFLLFVSSEIGSSEIGAETEALHGKWGTEAQCAEELIIPEGTKHASPFIIQRDWLHHGDVWCRLNWLSATASEQSTVALANAVCGEDSVRDYRIKFQLTGDMLSIGWGIGSGSNGPLMRCLN